MNWYSLLTQKTSSGESSNSPIMRHLQDVVDLGLTPGTGRLPVAPSPWHRPGPKDDGRGAQDRKESPTRRRRRKEKHRRLMEGTEPASQQSNLPTDTVGNSPEGTGRMGLA